jgi:hypothetical protein
MKTTLFVLCLICATAALGQSVGASSISNQPQMVQFYSHPEHAAQLPMAQEQSLLIPSAYTHARGERPLWEFAPAWLDVPLGDTARLLRKEHAAAKKSDTVWVNY